jgi:hypothetical protein
MRSMRSRPIGGRPRLSPLGLWGYGVMGLCNSRADTSADWGVAASACERERSRQVTFFFAEYSSSERLRYVSNLAGRGRRRDSKMARAIGGAAENISAFP